MAGPNALGKLMQEVMDREGWTSISELSRHTRAVSYQSLYAWITGKPERNRQRPPAALVLRRLAEDLRIPEPVLFAAAGRAHESVDLDPQALEFASILRDIPAGQRQDVIVAASLASRLSPRDMRVVLRLIRDLAEGESA